MTTRAARAKDSEREDPQGWCKHRIATALFKRAAHMAKWRLRIQLDRPETACPHHEALVSANCHVTLGVHQMQLTIRAGATAEEVDQVICNMQRALERFPSVDATTTTAAEGWCSIHEAQMTKHTNGRGSWWSHQLADGS